MAAKETKSADMKRQRAPPAHFPTRLARDAMPTRPENVNQQPARTPNVLMLGTGEYTTGFVGTGAADSDKGTGVVALVMLDLQRRGKVGRLGMCGTNGKKLPQIRAHMQRVLGDVYTGIDPSRVETWPADDVVDPKAYLAACEAFEPGDVAIIFTPDDTHYKIAAACLSRGVHALPPRTLRASPNLSHGREGSERGPPCGSRRDGHARSPSPRVRRHACAGHEAPGQDAPGAQRARRARAAGGAAVRHRSAQALRPDLRRSSEPWPEP